GLAGPADQGQLVAARGQVPVHGVVAQVGGAADEPAPERRVVVVEDALRLHLPVDRAGSLAPELFRLFHRAPVKVFVTHDGPLPEDGPSIDPARGGRRATLVETCAPGTGKAGFSGLSVDHRLIVAINARSRGPPF